ncbi:MAG: hypothetical protein JO290_13430 [Sphingomonadaceae bacterium]|nr:hypothetical protein [Sphingomonadaceae bacterium]
MPGSGVASDAVRRGFPVGATRLTLVMLPILLGLSYWQYAIRRPWKHDLIARLEAARALPPVPVAALLAAQRRGEKVQYRQAMLDCRPGRVKPYDFKGGTSASDDGGFLVLVGCGQGGKPGAVAVVAGWTLRPDAVTALTVDARFTGTLIEHPYGDAPGRPSLMLIPTTAVPPLAVSRTPVPDDLSDNHLSYALQWLAFAVTLAIVYLVYLRQWRRGAAHLAPPDVRR